MSEPRVEILEGAEARETCAGAALMEPWADLARADPRLTVIQEPAFVNTWYAQYEDAYEPITVLAWSGADRLIGLMPMARRRADGVLTQAGDYQAEYHGWICPPDHTDRAVPAMISALGDRYQLSSWSMGWLPPGTTDHWATASGLERRGINADLHAEDSPVLDLSDEKRVKRIFKNRSLRSKLNRYKRKGEVRLERVTDHERTRQLMPVLARQCDFRQQAMHAVGPFTSDPNKAAFYLARQDHSAHNHFTVLWCGDDALAFHFGACTEDTVIWGLSSYDPLEGKNSPGALLLVELVRLMQQEGRQRLDLTPGGDAYKERFSSGNQPLLRPTLHFTRGARLAAGARQRLTSVGKEALASVGVSPAQVRGAADGLRRATSAVRKAGVQRGLSYLRDLAYENRRFTLYRLARPAPLPEADPEHAVQVQGYDCLQHYKGTDPWLPRQVMQQQALRRFSGGQTLYSITRDGLLSHCGWVTRDVSQFRVDGTNEPVELPEGSVVIHDLFTEYSEFDCAESCLCASGINRMVADCRRDGATEIFVCLDSRSPAALGALAAAGFEHFQEVSKRRVLFWKLEPAAS